MTNLTRANAQDRAVEALTAAGNTTLSDPKQAYAVVALAWATLAQTLPTDLVPSADRPFGEATSR